MDAGPIGPNYQPGHAHADSLQILLNYKGKAILVDTGTSTYNKSKRRQLERSTVSHNTVTIDGKNSSAVWGGFRVGKRAQVRILEETPHGIRAAHKGYGYPHCRTIKVSSSEIILEDKIDGAPRAAKIQGHLHFPPDTVLTKSRDAIIAGELIFEFAGTDSCDILEYDYASGFNYLQKAPKITYNFQDHCTVRIYPVSPNASQLKIV